MAQMISGKTLAAEAEGGGARQRAWRRCGQRAFTPGCAVRVFRVGDDAGQQAPMWRARRTGLRRVRPHRHEVVRAAGGYRRRPQLRGRSRRPPSADKTPSSGVLVQLPLPAHIREARGDRRHLPRTRTWTASPQ